MDRPADLGHLPSEDWDRLQEILDRFEEAWQKVKDQSLPVDLAEFLPPPDDPLRRMVLHELVKTDLEYRWRGAAGLRLELEEYLERYPELGAAASLPVALIYEEHRVRQLYGDRPALAGYERRFPAQFAELQQRLHDQPVPTVPDAVGDPAYTLIVPPSSPPSTGDRLLEVGGGYELLQRIGAGSFGEVWRAEAPGGVEVAVKIIYRPVDHKEAQRELRALELIKRLHHPFLLQTHTYFSTDDRLVIVMELADGSLRGRWKQCREQTGAGIPAAELLGYLREAAEALDYLHGEQVLHRDIKPDNILLLKRHAKVGDFGLARLLQGPQVVLTTTGGGTPAYMAPETFRSQAGPGSDQYSLAVTYAELRLQRQLFPARNMMTMLREHLEEPPDLVPLPVAEQAVLLKALAPDPAGRFGHCLEFVDALEEALADDVTPIRGRRARPPADSGKEIPQPASSAPRQEAPPPSAAGPRGRLWVALVIVSLVAIGALVLLFFTRGR